MISIKIENADGVDEYLKLYKNSAKSKVQNVIKKSTYRITRSAKNNLESNGSRVTGTLIGSVNSKISSFQGVSGPKVRYGKYVEEGTRPHIIRAKNKKALFWEGASHPVKQVKHPGTKAKPYLVPAYEQELPKYMKDLRKAITPE